MLEQNLAGAFTFNLRQVVSEWDQI